MTILNVLKVVGTAAQGNHCKLLLYEFQQFNSKSEMKGSIDLALYRAYLGACVGV